MFELAICEIFNRNIHGYTNQSSRDIDGHILVNITFTPEEFMNNEWHDTINILKSVWQTTPNVLKQHHFIKNYKYIVGHPSYYKLNIVQLYELPGGECVAIIKTGLLKNLQRRWRKWMNNR